MIADKNFELMMKKSLIDSSLSSVWKTDPKMKTIVARKLLDSFSDLDWLLLVYMDFKSRMKMDCSIVEIRDNGCVLSILTDNVRVELLLSSGTQQPDEYILLAQYDEFNKFAYIKKAGEGTLLTGILPTKTQPVQLLVALSYIKYHLDSLLYLSQENRRDRLKELEVEFSLSTEQIISLDKQLRSVSEF